MRSFGKQNPTNNIQYIFKYLVETYNLPGSGMFQWPFRSAPRHRSSCFGHFCLKNRPSFRGAKIIDFLRLRVLGAVGEVTPAQHALGLEGTPTLESGTPPGGVIVSAGDSGSGRPSARTAAASTSS